MELHIIMVCAIFMAINPARGLYREIKNWMVRQRNHRDHLRKLEEMNG